MGYEDRGGAEKENGVGMYGILRLRRVLIIPFSVGLILLTGHALL